ncbi:Vps62-related protein [Chondromyces crocatus]|nr:Vps62-related protein [Chondromyces crocatus]
MITVVNAEHRTSLGARSDGGVQARAESYGAQFSWTVDDAGNGLVYLVSEHGLQLGARPDGSVYLSSNRLEWERWRITGVDQGAVAITSAEHKTNLSARPDGSLFMAGHVQAWEKWSVATATLLGKSVVFANAEHRTRLVAAPDGGLSASKIRPFWETWTLESAGDGQYYLVNPHGRLLGSKADGAVYTTENRAEWERWRIKAAGQGAFAIVSAQHGLNLGARPDGSVYTVGHVQEWERWRVIEALGARQIRELVQRYAPTLFFHPEEPYVVGSPQRFLDEATMFQVDTGTSSALRGQAANLPTHPDAKDKVYLTVPQDKRAGNLDEAEALVRVKLNGEGQYLDLQYWFFYPYNGHATAKAFPFKDHLSLAPFGRHEGDWEHVTFRFVRDTMALESVYMSQHAGGTWFGQPAQDLEWERGRPVVYSSLNGHACYPRADSNIHPRSHVSKLYDVGLRNDTSRGRSKDFIGKCQILCANYLSPTVFPPPKWLDFTGRWGKIGQLLRPSFGGVPEPIKGALEKIVNSLPKDIFSESGPEGPARKGSWNATWSGDDESVSPPWLPGRGLITFYQGQKDGGELWRTFSDGTQWSRDAQIPHVGMSDSPSAVRFNGQIYCFHQGYGDCGELWYNVFDGNRWLGDTKVQHVGMSSSPSAVVFNGKLYCFHQGGGNCGELWYSVFDGNRWLGATKVQHVGMSSSPSAVVFNGKLYCFHQGHGDNGELWYSVFDGNRWLGDTKVQHVGMSSSPSAAVYNGKLYCFHEGYGNCGELWYSVFDGNRWLGDTKVERVGMSDSPSAVVFDGKLYCFHQGHGDNGELWYSVFDGSTWHADTRLQGVGLSAGPSVIAIE